MVRIIPAMAPTDTMSLGEVEHFLRESKVPLKLGTVDKHGDPLIHPLWYLYDHGKFYMITASGSKKMRNISRNGLVYFCVDTSTRPYKGVKGKGTILQVMDQVKAMMIGRRIVTKYMDSVDNPLGKFLIGRLGEGKETVLEVTPRYFSVWDDSKSP